MEQRILFLNTSVGKESTCNAGDSCLIPGSGRSPAEWIGYPLQYSWASLATHLAKNPRAMQETWVRSLGWEDPLEKATHSNILVWRIPWTVSSWGSKESAFTFTLPNFHVPQITCFPNLILVFSSLVQVFQRSKNVWNLNGSASRTQLSATIQATSTTLTESPLQSNHQLFHTGSSLKHYFNNFKQFSLICKVQFTATNKPFCQAKGDKCVFQHH